MLRSLLLLILFGFPANLIAKDLEFRKLPKPNLRLSPEPTPGKKLTQEEMEERAKAYIEGKERIKSMAREEDESFVMSFEEMKDSEYERWPEQVYIDPDLDVVKITKEPGQSWAECARDAGACVAQANSKTRITRVTGVRPLSRQELNIATGELQSVEYIKVRFNGPGGAGEGWIDASTLRTEKMAAIYKTDGDADLSASDCPPGGSSPMQPTQNQRDVLDLMKAAKKSAQEQLDASVASMDGVVGQCPLGNPQKKKTAWKDQNIYDFEVYPRLEKQKDSFPSVLKEDANGEVVSRKASLNDVVAIDTLARTLYSEMNECFSVGVQYPMAAAKVALNRVKDYEEDGKPKLFVGGPQIESKPTISKVMTAPYQFSVWNYKSGPKDMTLLMSLCPAKDAQDAKNWKGHQPTPDDIEAWDLSLKIATEAILFPKRFEQKTSGVSQLYYTSKRKTYDGRASPNPAPKIEGRSVKSFKCMYLWEGK